MRNGKKSGKRYFEVEDICRYRLVTAVALSPDEKKVAYTIESIADDKRKYFSHIFLADVASGAIRQYTFGEINDRGIVWSPDGDRFAFVSTRNKRTGIFVMPAEGGGERLLLERDGSFSGLAWTPDGKNLVYQFRFNDSHAIKDPEKKNEAPLFRHITRLFYKLDGAGFLPQDRNHIWKVDAESGQDTQLTSGKYDEVSPNVSPDGKMICFVSNRQKDPDLENSKEDLFVMPLTGGRERRIPTPDGPINSPAFSPDGKKIAYLGHANPNDTWGATNYHLWSVGVSGNPVARDLIPKFDRTTLDATIGDLGEGFGAPAPVWSRDGKRIYFCASDMGRTHIFYAPARGGLPTRVTRKDCHIKAYSFGKARTTIAAALSTLTVPSDLIVFPAVYDGDKKARILDAPSRKLLSGVNLPAVKEIRFEAYDGTELQGWLVTPPDFSRSKKYPGILEIHGGPRAQYGFTYYNEMLLLASQGYVVFYMNPRGGQGRGETFAATIDGAWGTIDYSDCMAAADYLVGLPFVNAKKTGVTGGSYGGYMTNWMIGQTQRFRAAVTQRSVTNLSSMFGSSDVGYDLHREFGGMPWTNEETYVRCSPLTYAANIKTPLLIIHSEQDLRCPMEQAEQLFIKLKMLKKKVEMVRFPDEPHGLSRHGRPDRRIARLEWIIKWFDRYLK